MIKSRAVGLDRLLYIFSLSSLIIIITHIFFLFLVFTTAFDYFFGLDYHFHLDGEFNIPSIFSTLMLVFSAGLLLKIFTLSRAEKYGGFWLFLSMIFTALAADELLSFHERLMLPLRSYFNLTDYFYYSWILAGALLVIIIFLASLPFLQQLPRKYACRFLIAGAIFVSGVIGMEMIGAKEAYDSGYVYGWVNTKERGLTYAIIVTLEETLEICGILYFNFSLAHYLTHVKNVRHL